MDITILLALQDFRNGAGAVLADFMAKMTFLSEINSALVIMAVVYWCVHKEFGTYLLMGWSGNRLVNGFLKVTFCAYRPWIRDARIVPYGNAITTATGYSFPSGHTTNAASVFGGSALRKELPPLTRWLLGIAVVLVGLSRCFLGVHTPQDVLVGGLAGMLVLWLVLKLTRWVEAGAKRDLIVAGVGLGIGIALALYAHFKSYPSDYDATGARCWLTARRWPTTPSRAPRTARASWSAGYWNAAMSALRRMSPCPRARPAWWSGC